MKARATSWALVMSAVFAGAAGSNAPPSRQGAAPDVRASAPELFPAVLATLPKSPLSEDQQIMHALNRLGYGPRPGDEERVRQLGLARWIERQLEPGRIADDRAEAALQAFPTLTMPVPELVRAFPEPDQKVLARLQSGQMSQEEMRAMAPPEKRPLRIAAELRAAKLTRAVLSERQLEEVMTDI